MSSIWTPSGEYQPAEEPDGPCARGRARRRLRPATDPRRTGAPITPEELEAMRRLHEQLRATPAVDMMANHVVQLFQLALVYLGAGAAPDRGRSAARGRPRAGRRSSSTRWPPSSTAWAPASSHHEQTAAATH